LDGNIIPIKKKPVSAVKRKLGAKPVPCPIFIFWLQMCSAVGLENRLNQEAYERILDEFENAREKVEKSVMELDAYQIKEIF
jgi:hypothetical protein